MARRKKSASKRHNKSIWSKSLRRYWSGLSLLIIIVVSLVAVAVFISSNQSTDLRSRADLSIGLPRMSPGGSGIQGYCPQVVQPVCGVDGKTYTNSCEAALAGVKIKFNGRCEDGPAVSSAPVATPYYPPVIRPSPVTYSPRPLPSNMYYPGVRVSPLATRLPVPSPVTSVRPASPVPQTRPPVPSPKIPDFACAQVYIPVCGVDGVTYSNECVARQFGVSIKHKGPCEDKPVPSATKVRPMPFVRPSPGTCAPPPRCINGEISIRDPEIGRDGCPVYICRPNPPTPWYVSLVDFFSRILFPR